MTSGSRLFGKGTTITVVAMLCSVLNSSSSPVPQSIVYAALQLLVLLDIQGTGIGIGYSAAHRVLGNFVAVSCQIKDPAVHEIVATLNPVLRGVLHLCQHISAVTRMLLQHRSAVLPHGDHCWSALHGMHSYKAYKLWLLLTAAMQQQASCDTTH